ncbi:transmembrane protein 115 [Drosophila guanche]|uniref:Blast:Transmembrane protein 115 n=1 Tax=Drosophila guanche TaxID=7266 RepID=A0A3B0KBH3_DROGU|nr:transmembrane protein 115 [Drosophila guanche]SPP90062.1 blast:Transmembrane protein 115 [Drosophila guanche]
MSAPLARNWPYIWQQLNALLHNTSPVITLICVVTTFGYLLSFSEQAILLLSVTPGYILPNGKFWIWTAFTFCFIELHWWEVAVDVVTVGLCGKMLEPLWGQLEMFKFFALSNFGVSLLTTIYYLFYYMVTKNPTILFDVHIHGLAGYVAGICVAVRQIMPDHLIFKTRYGRLTNRNVPLTVLIMAIISWAIGLLDGTYPAMFASGSLVSWIYLRFYQHHPNGRGDSSESFTFVSFFPSVSQPFISVLVNPIYNCCLRVGVVKTPTPLRTISTASLTSISVQMPGADPHDIERRRQIALKALSERLKATDSTRHAQLPKSYPVQSQLQQQHHHHHQHHQQQKHHSAHSHGHTHSHGAGHIHSHSGAAGHSHGPGPAQTPQPDFLKPSSNSTQLPITTSRAEPRMISTMSNIAIPMPAPSPKDGIETAVAAPTAGGTATATLITLDDIPSTSSSASF